MKLSLTVQPRGRGHQAPRGEAWSGREGWVSGGVLQGPGRGRAHPVAGVSIPRAALVPISRLWSCTPLWPQRRAHTCRLRPPPTPATSLPSRRSPCCARGVCSTPGLGVPPRPSWTPALGLLHPAPPDPVMSSVPASSDHGGQPVSPSLPMAPDATVTPDLPTWPPPRLHVLGDPGPWLVLPCRARWSVSTT